MATFSLQRVLAINPLLFVFSLFFVSQSSYAQTILQAPAALSPPQAVSSPAIINSNNVQQNEVLNNQSAEQSTTNKSSQLNTTKNSETLSAFEDEFSLLEEKINEDEHDIEEYAMFYARLKPVIFERIDNLLNKINKTSFDLSIQNQSANNYPKQSQAQKNKNVQQFLADYAELKNYFMLRERLFNEASHHFVQEHTSIKPIGIDEAELEWRYLRIQFYVVYKKVSQRIVELPKRFSKSTVSLVSEIGTLLIIIIVFTWARRKLSTVLPNLQKSILTPRTQTRVQVARFIWYINQTRAPLEWLLLIYVLVVQLDFLQIAVLDKFIWSAAVWICFTLFIFKVLSTLISRGKQALTKEISSKQIWALKLSIFGFGVYMCVQELTLLFIHEAAIYSWVSTLLFIASVPIYFFFVLAWKNNAFIFVRTERDASEWAKKLAQKPKGVRGFINGNICIAYCIYFALTKAFLQLISRLETGRRLTTELYRSRLIRDNEEFLASLTEQEKLSTEQRELLVRDKSFTNDSVCEKQLMQIDDLLAIAEKSHLAVISERGLGKTTFLSMIAAKHPTHILINCSASFDNIYFQLISELGLPVDQIDKDDVVNTTNITPAEIVQAMQAKNINVMLLDNVHYLITPTAGGQKDIKRLLILINDLRGQALWVMSFESNAWQLINALSVSQGFFNHKITLSSWSEEHISELLNQRSENANILPTYEHLYIPRQIVDIDENNLTDRNRSGIYRMIWSYAEGNPAISVREYAGAIIKQKNEYFATMPISPDTKRIEGLDINTLLVLRVILQFGRAGTSDIMDNLRLNGLVVNSALATCLAQGFIENAEGGYQISWLWFRAITKFLDRQNLLSH
ncbi:ATP-binding protein [Colwellia sp. E2M01]|uniref:ATP-binding protein n=1 Tax=Colwellia sp. E2M01 TaxID=2841561 RepID=UPI001C0916F6|nr:ATP-binding protein [Colwellia sp. E2M01]MBU2872141.1 ATP-binding protein [Colwellia sp. E2M01]